MMELLGLLLPPAIDLINRKIIDDDLRFLVSVGVCFVLGVIVNFVTSNGFEGYNTLIMYADGIGKSIILVFGFAQLSFQGYWKKTETHKDMKGF